MCEMAHLLMLHLHPSTFSFYFPFKNKPLCVLSVYLFVNNGSPFVGSVWITYFLALAFMLIKTLLRWLNVKTIIGSLALLWETHLRSFIYDFFLTCLSQMALLNHCVWDYITLLLQESNVMFITFCWFK